MGRAGIECWIWKFNIREGREGIPINTMKSNQFRPNSGTGAAEHPFSQPVCSAFAWRVSIKKSMKMFLSLFICSATVPHCPDLATLYPPLLSTTFRVLQSPFPPLLSSHWRCLYGMPTESGETVRANNGFGARKNRWRHNSSSPWSQCPVLGQ